MSIIVTRAGKGASLSWAEADANFTNLNTDKIEVSTITATSGKTPVVDADLFPIVDSVGTVLNKVTWSNIKATLGAGFTMTGVFVASAGAAATPSIAASGNLNTGIWFPAADTIAFSTGGTERFRVDSSGNFTLASTSAAGMTLSVSNQSAGASAYAGISVLSNNGQTNIQVFSTAGGGLTALSSSTTAGLAVYTTIATSLFLGTNNNANHLVIDSTGNVTKNTATGLLGYGTGAGATVTQITSRNTGVTINKPTGAITLFTAAGDPVYNSFVVTNSTVGLKDVVLVSVQTSGALNLYETVVANVQAGSFTIYFHSISGTAFDTPVFNFAVIKGATS